MAVPSFKDHISQLPALRWGSCTPKGKVIKEEAIGSAIIGISESKGV